MKIKIMRLLDMRRVLALAGLLFLVVLSSWRFAHAQQVSQGYGADTPLERGMIVRLKNGDATKVTALKASEASFMFGVTVASNDAPITVTNDTQQSLVATSGRYEVLVSTQNGTINSGDYITISSSDGIGMKADRAASYVIGKAVAPFDGTTSLAGSTQVNGKSVQYGRVLADISARSSPLITPTKSPSFLQSAAQSISGHPVNDLRIYLGLFLAFATTVIAGSLLYAGVHGSIIAIGRNPLSKGTIGGNMIKVVLIGLIVFLGGLFGVYLLIKL